MSGWKAPYLALALLASAGAQPLPSLSGEVALPPTAARPIPDTLSFEGLSLRQVLQVLAGPPLLDLNLVITSRAAALDQPAGISARGLAAGELFELVLQLTGTVARRAGERTYVVTDPGDRRSFGRSRAASVDPVRALPSRVLAFLKGNEALRRRIDPARITADDDRGTLFLVGTEEEIAVVREAVALLDARDRDLWARIPLSHVGPTELQAWIARLAPEERGRLPAWSYVESGRMVVARGDAESLARLQDVVRAVDLAPGQVRLFLKLCQASSQDLSDLGVSLSPVRIQAESLDRLVRGRTRTSAAAQVEYLLSRTRARTLATRTLLLRDRTPTTLHLGETRNVRTVGAQVAPGTAVITQGTVEVPLGLQLAVEPAVHADGTATLALDFAEERALAITDFGIDRSTFSFSTTVRAGPGDPQVLAGFDQASRERSRRELGAAARRGADALFLVLWIEAAP